MIRVESSPLTIRLGSRGIAFMTADGSVSEQLRALTRLQNLSLKLSATLTLDDTLEAIIEAAMAVCRADSAGISYMNELGELRLLKHRGLSAEYVQQRQLTRVDPTLSEMMTTRLPSIVEDVDEFAAVSPNYPVWKKEGIASIVTLPLVSEGKVFGVIGAGSRSVRRYSKTEIDAMVILATQAGAAIINARLFEQLREAGKAKDEFLSTLSHELRTPLTPILGWTHLLKPFANFDPLLGQGLETIERNANQLLELIKDLLDLTRIISNKIELEREPTDLAALVRTAVAQMRPQAEARGVTIELSLPSEPIISDADAMRIQQIISNLLGNAVKFTPEGGRASVVLRRDGDTFGASERVVIEVIDTGVGIDPGFLPFVFERFTQGHEGIDRRYGGLGLGLAITRAMVELHGGEVTAQSDGPGSGSRFTVRLPITGGDAALQDEDSSEPVIDEREFQDLGLRVLIIEDSLDTLNMLKLWLGTFGCEVLVAAEAMEGVKLATERLPDLIISDIGMPDVDGYALMRMLRKTPGLEQVPAIALTGYAREEDRELALAAGYNAHISKPANMSRLLHLITKLTTRRPA
jgi:signal transduction histidine kinase/ActR/RegA family two-component response regulator